MRPRVLLLSLLSLLVTACTSTEDTTVCTAVVPAQMLIACDLGWSCGDGTTTYGLACSSEGASYLCTCNVDGVPASSVTVAPFDCTPEAALPTATSACKWNITVSE